MDKIAELRQEAVADVAAYTTKMPIACLGSMTNKPKIEEIIVVEGKDDTRRLRSVRCRYHRDDRFGDR